MESITSETLGQKHIDLMTTETQLMVYKHEAQHPYATTSIAYKELAKIALELDKKVIKLGAIIEEMEGGFIWKQEATNLETHDN